LVQDLQTGSKATTKLELGAWSPCRYQGGHRTLAKLIDVHAMVLDVDNKVPSKKEQRVPDDELVTLDGVLSALDGHEVYIYSSWNHAADWPRFRAVIPFSRAVLPDEYPRAWAAFRDRLSVRGISVDEQTKDASRLWFWPASSRPGYETRHQTGNALDVEALLLEAPPVTRTSRPSVDAGSSSDDRLDRARAYLAKCPPAIEGAGGHNTAWSVIRCVVRGFDLSVDAALLALGQWNDRCDPPWSDKELAHKAKQARESGKTPEIGAYLESGKKKKSRPYTDEELAEMGGFSIDVHQVANLEDEVDAPEPSEPAVTEPQRRYNLTDLGNAERLVARHGLNLKYVTSWGKWIRWDGKRWVEDAKGLLVSGLANETVRSLYQEALEATPEQREKIAGWAMLSESEKHLRAMVKLAATLPAVHVHHDELDADPFAINVANGILNLRTGELGPHSREALCTKIARVAYNPKADRSLFETAFRRSLPADDVRGYVMRLMGLSLTGNAEEHVLPVHYGSRGRNGKDTFLGSLKILLGDYADEVAFEILEQSGGASGHPTGLSLLFSRRFVLSSETGKGDTLNTKLAKRLSGGNEIQTRKMAQDFWGFLPTHTLHLATNHKPRIQADPKDPIWERVSLIEWTHIPPEARDKQLARKLQTVGAEGFFAAIVDACLEWQSEGLRPPESVRLATADYRDESDLLGDFIEERLVIEPGSQARLEHLFEAYQAWADRQGLKKTLSKSGLARELNEREVGQPGRDSKTNLAVRFGLRLRVLADDPEHQEREAKTQAAALEVLSGFGEASTDDSDVGPDDVDWLNPDWGKPTRH
jgi:P4 family phage/plasmid primase-like protien